MLNDVFTGSTTSDGVIKMLLVNPNLCGGVVACFLDNTVRGKVMDRIQRILYSASVDLKVVTVLRIFVLSFASHYNIHILMLRINFFRRYFERKGNRSMA